MGTRAGHGSSWSMPADRAVRAAVAQALRAAARQLELDGMPASAQTPSHQGPETSRWQTWRGFVLDVKPVAEQVRRDTGRCRKTDVCTRGGWPQKTLNRTMRWYGLDVRADWPPFNWNPDEPRSGGKA